MSKVRANFSLLSNIGVCLTELEKEGKGGAIGSGEPLPMAASVSSTVIAVKG